MPQLPLDSTVLERTGSSLSEQPVHPLELWQTKDWLIPEHAIRTHDLEIEHHIESPDTLATPPLTHHMLLLQLSHGVRQVVRFEQEEYDGPLPSGGILLQPAGISGFFHWESTDEALVFVICPKALKRVAAETGCLNSQRIELKPLLPQLDPQIEQIGRSFLMEMQTPGLGEQLYRESLTNLLLIHLLRRYSIVDITFRSFTNGLGSQKLKQALDYIHERLEQSISLDSMAHELDMSSYYFCRLFRQSMGVTPYQYLIQQRVERARKLLKRQPKRPIIEIALDCGFTSHSQFNRHFRKLIGTSPSTYRQG